MLVACHYAWDVLLGEAYDGSTEPHLHCSAGSIRIIIHEPCQSREHRRSTWTTATPVDMHRLSLGTVKPKNRSCRLAGAGRQRGHMLAASGDQAIALQNMLLRFDILTIGIGAGTTLCESPGQERCSTTEALEILP